MSNRRWSAGLALTLTAVIAAPAAATPPGTNGLLTWFEERRNRPPHLIVAQPDGSGAREVFATARNRGEIEGTFSPTDPNLMFFTRVSQAQFTEDVFSGNLATGAVRRVTRGGSADLAPTVSPDGRRIAYHAFPRPRRLGPDAQSGPPRIHVANVDGSGDRAITPRRRGSIDADWSPDGTRLAFSEGRRMGRRDQSRLMVMNADGSGRRAITRFGGADEVNPKWTPDGNTIVFERMGGRTRSDVMAMPADGGPARAILATPANETNPVPSPDGTRIVFTSDRDRRGRERLGPSFEVYTMAVDGSDVVRITNNRALDAFPDWQRLP